MIKKMSVLLLGFLLIGCADEIKLSEVTQNFEVYIGLEQVETIEYKSELYVDVSELEAFDIDVLIDEKKEKAYLSDSDFPQTISNDRSYNWYIDQGNTGTYSGANCGPASSVMVAMWQDKDFSITPREARGQFKSSGGWWYTNDIKDFFDKHDVAYEVDEFDGPYELIGELSRGNIILLCIDTTYLEAIDDDDSYIGKFYDYSGGHFLIVKGYTYIDRELYFEIYDSNCWYETYSDGSPKGKDRLYPADEIEISIETWWDNYIIIKK